MKKRFLSLALAVVMVCALAPTAALAAEVVPCKYDWVSSFHEGLAAVELNGKCGYIDQTGKEVVPCKYNATWTFQEGRGEVLMGEEEGGKYGFVDSMGKEVIPLQYDDAHDFSEGLAAVKLDGKWGFIDTDGLEVVPCQYDAVDSFSEGLALVGQDGKYGFIDQKGTLVIPMVYDGFTDGLFSDGLVVMEQGGLTSDNDPNPSQWGCIDKTGQVVVPFGQYGYIQHYVEGLAAVAPYGKYGFIDRAGNQVIPCQYDTAWNFSEGLSRVGMSGFSNMKWGFIDKTGKEVVPCQYDYAWDFSEGLAAVVLNGKCGYIDQTGKEVIPCQYNLGGHFSEGFAFVVRNGRYGFIDKTGKEVVPCKYDYALNFSEGLASVQLNDKCGVVSADAAAPAQIAYPSVMAVDLDGEKVEFQCYALKEGAGLTNYIKLRDFADLMNGTTAQFQVGWDGTITITTKTAYTPNGSEQETPFSGERAYEKTAVKTLVDGKETDLDTFQLKDDNGGGYTYYKLRDLGATLGITVDWSPERGVFIETK